MPKRPLTIPVLEILVQLSKEKAEQLDKRPCLSEQVAVIIIVLGVIQILLGMVLKSQIV